MAKRQRQLNKNLIAGLTAAAMVITVAVVTVVTVNAARRDPQEIAKKAAAAEAAGQYRDAAQMYTRAFGVNREPQYLIDASRCLYEMGELSQALSVLNQAHAQEPDNLVVLNALLERFWELRNYAPRWSQMKEYADKALELQPDNLLALVSRAAALDALKSKEPTYAEEAVAALEKAVKMDPTDPRVVELRVRRLVADASSLARQFMKDGDEDKAQQTLTDARTKSIDVFREAIRKHPKSDALYLNLAQVLMDNERYDEAAKVFDDAIKSLPDDEKLYYGQARFHFERARALFDDDKQQAAAHAKAAMASVTKAIELEPALYDAYALRAGVDELQSQLAGTWDKDRVGEQVRILTALQQALADTVGLKTINAVLGREARARLLAAAFDRAISYYKSDKDKAAKDRIMPLVEGFRDRAHSEFSEVVMVPLMDGQYAVLIDDRAGAIQAFRAAEDKAGALGTRYELMAKQQLARLYTLEGENGVALKYTDATLQWYSDHGMQPPLTMLVNRANLLSRLDRAQEALDLCDTLLQQAPNNPTVLQVRSAALFKLGRGEEARRTIEKVADTDTTAALMKARIAAASGDLAEAERVVREILDKNPDDTTAITLGVQVLIKADQHDKALALLDEVAARATNDDVKRVIQAQRVALTTKDPEQRRQKLFELIADIPDPVQRNAEYFNYYYDQGDFDKAAEYADKVEALRPDDAEVLEIQFELAMRTKRFDKAEKYVSRLAEINADHAGGATYRGQLKFQQGDYAGALTELQAAERALPTDSNLKVQIAQTLWLLQQYDAALDVVKQAIDLDPTDFRANKLAYRFLENLDRATEGAQYLVQAAKLNPNDEYIKQRQQELTEVLDPAKGIETREQRRDEAPDDVDNLVKLARLYMRVGDGKNAEARMLEAYKLNPENRAVAVLAKDLYAKLGNREGGEKLLRDYISKRNMITKVGGVLLLEQFYDALGDRQAAEAAFAEAQKAADDLTGQDAERGRRAKLKVWRELADYQARHNDPASMVDSARQALALLTAAEANTARSVRLQIIQGLLAQNKLSEAETEIGELQKAFPDDPSWMLPAAELAIRRDDLEKGRELLTEALEIDPNQKWCLWMRGRTNLLLRRFEEAKADLLKAKELAPNDFGLAHRVRLAQLYMMLEQYELAETEIRELVALQPNNPKYAMMLIGLLRNTGKTERAQEFVNQLIARNPKNPVWPAQLGALLMQRGEYSSAVRPLARAVELTDHKNPRYVAQWLDALIKAKRIDEAISALKLLDPSVMTPAVQTYAAQAHIERGNQSAAEDLLRTALRQACETSVAAVGYVGDRAASILGQDAADRLIGAELARTDIDAAAAARLQWYQARAVILANDLTKMPEAMKTIDNLIANAEAGSSLQLEALQLKALGLQNADKADEAVACYEQILKVAPDSALVLNNAAYLLADAGRTQEAIAYAERARTLLPNNANVLDTLGWAYYRDGQADKAESVLLEALAAEPRNLTVLYHIGQMYQQSNRRAEARRYYERLIKAAEDTKQRDSEYAAKARDALKLLR